jgi:hypothetical protein
MVVQPGTDTFSKGRIAMDTLELTAIIRRLTDDPDDVQEITNVICLVGAPISFCGDAVVVTRASFAEAVSSPFRRTPEPMLPESSDTLCTGYFTRTIRAGSGRWFQVQRRFCEPDVEHFLTTGAPHSEPAVQVREIVMAGNPEVAYVDMATVYDGQDDDWEGSDWE